jgi:phosphoribosylamine--glycine ligase
MTTVCVVGSGGREHALAAVLARTADVVVVPGNGGTDGIGGTVSPVGSRGLELEGHRISSSNLPPEAVEADLYVIGPEAPLVDGLADRLRAQGRLVVGPGADGARLEGSKAYMKDLATRAGVPTARWASFSEEAEALAFLRSMPPPFVVKTDGLAAGKGVLVTSDLAAAEEDVRAKLTGESFGAAGRRVVIEEGLSGPELSVLVLCDGKRAVPLAPAQDFKRIGDAETGPNTGGMGAYSPVRFAPGEVVGKVMDEIVEPALATLAGDGVEYRGVLYAGLMLTDEGPRLVEFNVRFGDPEAQVVLPRLDCDLTELLIGVASGDIGVTPAFTTEAAVCVVCAAPGYPGAPRTGDVIDGVAEAATVTGVTVFHSGTVRGEDGLLRSAGGRVLGVTAMAPTLHDARRRAYEAVARINLPGMQYRGDIALAAAAAETAAAETDGSGLA